MDIVIYTNPEILEEKTQPDFYCYWSMARIPKFFKDGEKIFFAIKGKVVGYFRDAWLSPEDPTETLNFDGRDWKKLKRPIPCKPFRGFRYRWW